MSKDNSIRSSSDLIKNPITITIQLTMSVPSNTSTTPSSAAAPAPAEEASLNETLTQYSKSPIPALLFSGSLIATPLIRPRDFKYSVAYPTNTSILLFGAFTGLGSFLTFDNDPVNGAGLTSAWSFMYLLINGRKSIFNFKIYPKYLASLALVNTAVYGGLFFGIIGDSSNSSNKAAESPLSA